MSIWGEGEIVKNLYKDRVSGTAEEMGSAKQLVEILEPHVKPGMSVLDVGCGAGYFYHSLKKIGLEYYGVDPTTEYIEIGKKYLPDFSLPANRLQVKGIEEISGTYDIVVCFSVLQHLPVDLNKYINLLTDCSNRFLVLRSSFYDGMEVVREIGIDKDSMERESLVITYPKSMVLRSLENAGFDAEFIIDSYTNGKPEMPYTNDVKISPGLFFARKQ